MIKDAYTYYFGYIKKSINLILALIKLILDCR